MRSTAVLLLMSKELLPKTTAGSSGRRFFVSSSWLQKRPSAITKFRAEMQGGPAFRVRWWNPLSAGQPLRRSRGRLCQNSLTSEAEKFSKAQIGPPAAQIFRFMWLGLTAQHFLQPHFCCRPFRVQNAVVYRVADVAVRQDPMLPENPFLRATDPFDGLLRP